MESSKKVSVEISVRVRIGNDWNDSGYVGMQFETHPNVKIQKIEVERLIESATLEAQEKMAEREAKEAAPKAEAEKNAEA